jgi:hypothetical protein
MIQYYQKGETMDYTVFVKGYYVTLMRKFEKYSNYTGTIVTVTDGYIPNLDNIVEAQRSLDILPSYNIVMNAPLSEFEDLLEHYSQAYPELAVLFLGKVGLYRAYNLMIEKKIPEDKQDDYIDLLLDISFNVVESLGVLR